MSAEEIVDSPKIDKVEELRAKYRSERRSFEASASAFGHSEEPDGEIRSIVPPVGRSGRELKAERWRLAADRPGTDKIAERIGQSDRRSGNDGRGTPNGDLQVAGGAGATATLEAVDNVLPLRKEAQPSFKEEYFKGTLRGETVYKRKDDVKHSISEAEYQSLPSKVKAVPPEPAKIGKGKVLSDAEVEDLREPLEAALPDFGSYVDTYLRGRPGWSDMPDIWGDLTELETAVLVRVMLRRGQQNAVAASVVRNLATGMDTIQAAVIVGDRFMRFASFRQSKVRRIKK